MNKILEERNAKVGRELKLGEDEATPRDETRPSTLLSYTRTYLASN